DALAAELGEAVRLNTAVLKAVKTAGAWQVHCENGLQEYTAIIYCGTAYQLAQLRIESPGLPDLSPLGQIRYAPIASVVLGFHRRDVGHPLDGFGMLIPKIENFKILGAIFSSSLFPNRAPADSVTLTSYLGGERTPELAFLPAEEAIGLTRTDLRALIGAAGEPVFSRVAFHRRAIPQYNVGYGKFKETLENVEKSAPGLFFAGHYRNGVSLGDSIVAGAGVAKVAAKWSQAANRT
ncbi:MAG: protoporphyrinogen oxidase, partial [Verrucomicrobia bacterium]|nr:protoporphyrinogen oxidase [Verrucomicrobiota bacterium]